MNKQPTYRTVFVTGDYRARQTRANELGVDLYLEGHANSSENADADYAMCVVGSNASRTSMDIGKELARRFGGALDVGGDKDTDIGYGTGIRRDGRGDGNVRYTQMPAVLMEPGFASNRNQALLMESEYGLATIALIIYEVVAWFIPSGSLIALSIGHLGKNSAPHDRGAAWTGDRFSNEAEFAHVYMHHASALLQNGVAKQEMDASDPVDWSALALEVALIRNFMESPTLDLRSSPAKAAAKSLQKRLGFEGPDIDAIIGPATKQRMASVLAKGGNL